MKRPSQTSSREEVATEQVERLLLALVLGFPGGSVIKNPPANVGSMCLIPGSGRSLEKEMATHSNILAWEIPWTEEPGWATVHEVTKSVRYYLATK